MANITLRSSTSATDPGSTSAKGAELSFVETDSNFILINNEVGTKIQLTNLSVTDSGGDGSLAYNNSTGVITYTGPSASEVRAHFSAGEGIDLSSGAISGEDASTSNKGIASFGTDHFTVSSGAVTLKTDGIDDTLIDFGTGTNQVSTADVPEQTNLYYTAERVDDQVDTLMTEGSNITLTYDDAAGTLTVAATGTATTINNNAVNRVITGSGTADTLNGQANMTFDGSNAVISGSAGGLTSPVLELVTDNSSWNTPQMMFQDSNDDVFSMVGRNNTGGGVYQWNITMDPNNTKPRTSVTGTGATYAGDYFVALQKNYSDQDEIAIDMNVFGAHAGFNIAAFDDYNGNVSPYGAKPINLKGSEVNSYADGTKELSITSSGVKIENNTLDLDGQDITMGGGDIDMEGGDLKDSSGVLKIADLSEQIVSSAGTVTQQVTNESATGLGVRIFGGETGTGGGGTAHTSGDLFLVQKSTNSGLDQVATNLFEVKSDVDGGSAAEGTITANNLWLTGMYTTGSTAINDSKVKININGTWYYINLSTV